jgi:hypothetical protein
MAIDKYSGLSQSDKFFARYGKSVGKETVKRQQTHLALESFKNKATAQLQLPNYAAQAPKQQLRLPNLAGGIYEQATQAATKPKVSDAFVRKMLKKIANDPTFNWRAADLKPEQIAAIEAKLGEKAAKKTAETAITQVAKEVNLPVPVSQSGSSVTGGLRKVAQAAASETPGLPSIVNPEAGAISKEGAEALAKVKKACNGKISVAINETRNSTLDKMAYYYKNLEKESAKSTGLLDKLKAFAKTKKGKIGIGIAIAAAVIGTGIYLFNRNKEKPGPVSDSSPSNDLANAPVNGQMTANGPYTVAKGDNVWTIARANLMELHKGEADYKPTDVQILQRTEEIMQLNDLHYEKDNYRVIIQPNQSLKLTA